MIVAVIAGLISYVIGGTHEQRDKQAGAETTPAESEKDSAGESPTALTSITSAETADSATAALANRDVYYPGSEALTPVEMRSCRLWYGHAERISAMKIPYDYLDEVFIGHLHANPVGDLDAIWIGGVISNRQKPLRIWGPSGSKEELGTKYMVDHMTKM